MTCSGLANADTLTTRFRSPLRDAHSSTAAAPTEWPKANRCVVSMPGCRRSQSSAASRSCAKRGNELWLSRSLRPWLRDSGNSTAKPAWCKTCAAGSNVLALPPQPWSSTMAGAVVGMGATALLAGKYHANRLNPPAVGRRTVCAVNPRSAGCTPSRVACGASPWCNTVRATHSSSKNAPPTPSQSHGL